MAHLIPAPQGKHHRRHKAGRHTTKTPPLKMSASDVKWVLLACSLPFLLLGTQLLPLTGVWVVVILTAFVVAALRRYFRHTGGRRYSAINPTPAEREEFLRTTGEIPVLEPTAMSHAPGMPPITVGTVRRPPWKPTKAQVTAFGIAAFVSFVAAYSNHRVETARRMEADIDSLLGIPGLWNNFQPTQPQMGTRGWGADPNVTQPDGNSQWQQQNLW